jgi:two-component system CheB/CheR fusion protein
MDQDQADSAHTDDFHLEHAHHPDEEPSSTGFERPVTFPVVGIGASAGGLAAFEQFFSNLPSDTGLAYVVVQHLSAPVKSILPEILQRYTSMEVYQVADGMEIKPDCVYVIPPGSHLILRGAHLILLEPPSERGFRVPIDLFFRSLAEARGSAAIGMILSGTASDGSLGIKSIKAGGGLTIAQDPETAEFEDMPRNAIATQDVDFVLPPEKMGELILKYVWHQGLDAFQVDGEKAIAPAITLQKLYHLIRVRLGHDFSLYKQKTLLRRIDRRIKITLVPTLDDYIDYLQKHPEEMDALFRDLLINVTHFFRDSRAFLALTDKAIRPLLPIKHANRAPLRAWVAGCSSGEEAYSIAIILQEQMEALNIDVKVQVFATDLDAEAIETARRGIYTDVSLEYVSSERLNRFFTKEEAGYQVKKSIRDMVVFSTQNLIFDPPFSKIDLLCCRNVLIYLEPELQKQVFPTFHYALNPGGILFLGNSESIGGFGELFAVIDRKYRIFYRKDADPRLYIRSRGKTALKKAVDAAQEPDARPLSAAGLREMLEKTLLQYHTPSAVLIDSKNIILYIHGRTGKYLEPAAGETGAYVLRMAREGLKAELATAIRAAEGKNETITRRGILVKTNGDYQRINLTVRPIHWRNDLAGLKLVVFEEAPEAPAPQPGSQKEASQEAGQVHALEKAIQEKDEYLSSIINELEEANQDLKSINEELMSSNEEMQSTNEELETSKEELQSVNEELTTVNAELQNKNGQLSTLNNDVYNLLASIDIGIVFLDLDMHIRRYTPAIHSIYNFLPADIGRSIQHFRANLDYDGMMDDIQEVLSTLIPKKVEVQSSNGSWFLVQIKPYRTVENIIDGVVVTFIDITQQKQGELMRRLATVVRDSNDAITVQDFTGKIQAWNRGAEQIYGWSEAEALQMNVREMVPAYLHDDLQDLYRRLSTGEPIRSYETKRSTRGGRVMDAWITLSILVDDLNNPVGISTTERDITEWKQAGQMLRFENRALAALSAWHTRPSHRESDPSAIAREVCQILVRSAGYGMAWVGRMAAQEPNHLELSGWDGFQQNDSSQPPKPAETMARRSQKLAAQALHSRQPVAVRNILTDPALRTWRSNAARLMYNSFIIIPIPHQHRMQEVLAVYAEEPEAFTDKEIQHLLKLVEGVLQAGNSPKGS